MSDEIREYLTQYYLEDMKKTENLLNISLKHWYN